MRALGKLHNKTSTPKNDLLSTETEISNLNTSIRMTITAWCSTSAFVSATSAQQSEESLTACWECCRIFSLLTPVICIKDDSHRHQEVLFNY